MKATLVMPFLAQGIAAGIVQRQQGSCTNDNCALAVSPLDARQAQIASDDCSSYLRTTLTVGVSTTTSTFTTTYWTITETCSTTSLALPKRAYGPYHSANTTTTPTASGTGTSISLGTSVSPVTTSPSGTTTDISQSPTIPTYATPCGIPYYYSSACACISIFPTSVYETIPVVTSVAFEQAIYYTTAGCTPTDTASVPETSSSIEVQPSPSIPTEPPSSSSSSSVLTSRPNLTVPGPPPTSASAPIASSTSSASSSSSSSIILSTFTVIPPTGPWTTLSFPPWTTGTNGHITAPSGTGSSSLLISPSPPFPMDNSTTTSAPTEGPTAITSSGTGTGPGVTFSEPTPSAPFPMGNTTSSAVGPTGTAPLVTGPIGTGGLPSVPTDVPSSSPPYPLSNDTSSTGPTAGPTGTAPLITGVPETSLSTPPYPITNETSPLGPTAGPTGTGSIGTGVTSIPSSPSAPFPMDNSTSIVGPTGTGSIGSSIPPGIETSSPPYPLDNSTSFPGPTGTGSIGTIVLPSASASSPPFPLTNTTSCSDGIGPTGTGNTTPISSSTATSNITASVSTPTFTFGVTGTGGIIVTGTGTGGASSPTTETGLFPNSTLGSPVQATESSSSLIGTGTVSSPTIIGTAPAVELPSPTDACTPSVHNTSIPGVDIGYQPNYASDYTGCFLDPNSSQGFNLVENGTSTPIVNVNGYAKRALSSSLSFDAYFTFEKPSGPVAQQECGVYDLAYHDGDTISYIAIFNDGVVAFVPTSSNGQDTADLTNQYVTSFWSIDCSGTLSAGITNQLPFEFSFVQTPNRGTLMVVNWDFDGDLSTAGVRVAGGTSTVKKSDGVTGPTMEKRRIHGEKVGALTLSLARLPIILPKVEVLDAKGNPIKAKRGPKPKSDRVLNL